MENKINRIQKLLIDCDNYRQSLKSAKEEIVEIQESLREYLKINNLKEVVIGDYIVSLKEEKAKFLIQQKGDNHTPNNTPVANKTTNILEYQNQNKKNKNKPKLFQ
jgi:hypothetical protein